MIGGAIAALLLVGALGAWRLMRGRGARGELGAITRVAVMPLRDISGSDAVFAESLQDALITGIAGMNLAGVVPRSELSDKGQSRRIRDVANEFKVDAVMEGTLFRAGDVMRINLQLVEPVSVRHYWTGSFELNVKNVLGAQDSLVRTINAQLRGVLAGERPQDRVDKSGDSNDDTTNARADRGGRSRMCQYGLATQRRPSAASRERRSSRRLVSFGFNVAKDGRLAFVRFIDGKAAIFVADAIGTNPKRVSFGVWDVESDLVARRKVDRVHCVTPAGRTTS